MDSSCWPNPTSSYQACTSLRQVAKLTFAESNAYAEQLLAQEYEFLQRLSHPNLPVAYSWGIMNTSPRCVFYAMNLCDGGSLKQLIEHRNSEAALVVPDSVASLIFSTLEMSRTLKGVMNGLCHMHLQEVAHLDVKPDNVLFDHGNRPILSDLGISRRLTFPGGTLTGMCGTDGFMAPEVERIFYHSWL